jgi:hypothetical protein
MHPHAVMQAVTSDHTSLQRCGLEPPCVPRPGPHLLAEVSSGAATCHAALCLTS